MVRHGLMPPTYAGPLVQSCSTVGHNRGLEGSNTCGDHLSDSDVEILGLSARTCSPVKTPRGVPSTPSRATRISFSMEACGHPLPSTCGTSDATHSESPHMVRHGMVPRIALSPKPSPCSGTAFDLALSDSSEDSTSASSSSPKQMRSSLRTEGKTLDSAEAVPSDFGFRSSAYGCDSDSSRCCSYKSYKGGIICNGRSGNLSDSDLEIPGLSARTCSPAKTPRIVPPTPSKATPVSHRMTEAYGTPRAPPSHSPRFVCQEIVPEIVLSPKPSPYSSTEFDLASFDPSEHSTKARSSSPKGTNGILSVHQTVACSGEAMTDDLAHSAGLGKAVLLEFGPLQPAPEPTPRRSARLSECSSTYERVCVLDPWHEPAACSAAAVWDDADIWEGQCLVPSGALSSRSGAVSVESPRPTSHEARIRGTPRSTQATMPSAPALVQPSSLAMELAEVFERHLGGELAATRRELAEVRSLLTGLAGAKPQVTAVRPPVVPALQLPCRDSAKSPAPVAALAPMPASQLSRLVEETPVQPSSEDRHVQARPSAEEQQKRSPYLSASASTSRNVRRRAPPKLPRQCTRPLPQPPIGRFVAAGVAVVIVTAVLAVALTS
eukprot:gnl/TRDRNA2_/TRDRNA2_80249_c0_seq1.p1 gnl/TRDRNA2_/TRDRNA2_80249_c0~~gnl/TRDRNA2_/TRDRNA2_80249_c0_seq1.p1  ORF type:complete len:607 (+),score=56.19 gnl/TRDRNA2_/TRDRNA2_80249_c0_seq1:85-1905(+)